MNKPCLCGCGAVPRYPGARFCHGHHLRLAAYKRKPTQRTKLCENCGTTYAPPGRRYSRSRFCSRACSQQSRRKGETRSCANCGAPTYATEYRLRTHPGAGTYCSRACRLADVEARSLAAARPGTYRANCWKVHERRCVDCGYDAYPAVLLVHHVDGNRQNGAITNLVPLCPTCHVVRHLQMTGSTRVPTFRG